MAPDATVALQLQRTGALQERALAPEAAVAASRSVAVQGLGALLERCGAWRPGALQER